MKLSTTLLPIALSLPLATLASPISPFRPPAQSKRDVLGGAASSFSWKSMGNLFVFGDSYTTTGWNVSNGVDLATNPSPGYTSSNGPNWVEYLNSTYNASTLSTYNLAYGGATIDSALVVPYLSTVQSLKTQVGLWEDNLANNSAVTWTADDSLFAIWIGINDIGNSWSWTNVSLPTFNTQLLDEYFSLVQRMYDGGGRNFLFLNVPPIDRTELFIGQGVNATKLVAADLVDFNGQLAHRVSNFTSSYQDVSTTYVDTNALFGTLLDNARVFGFANVTGYCDTYANGANQTNSFYDSCAAPVGTYFWLNTLHPTWPVHNILAHSIVGALTNAEYIS